MASLQTWNVPRRLVLLALPVLLLVVVAAGPARTASAQQPPQSTTLPDEEDGSFTDNEDPADGDPNSARIAPIAPSVVAPPGGCQPGIAAIVVPPGGGSPPCSPCPPSIPITRAVVPPDGPQIPIVPPPPVPCIDPSIRAVQGAVNLANQVESGALRTLDRGSLGQVFVKGAYWQVSGYVDQLWWRGNYADTRLLGVRHLDTRINGGTATSRSLERWEYREYDLWTGQLVYSTTMTVENNWTLMKVGRRWMVADIQIFQR